MIEFEGLASRRGVLNTPLCWVEPEQARALHTMATHIHVGQYCTNMSRIPGARDRIMDEPQVKPRPGPLLILLEMVGEVGAAVAYMGGVVVVERVLRPLVTTHESLPFLVDWTLLGLDLTLFLGVLRRMWRVLNLLLADILKSNVVRAISDLMKGTHAVKVVTRRRNTLIVRTIRTRRVLMKGRQSAPAEPPKVQSIESQVEAGENQQVGGE